MRIRAIAMFAAAWLSAATVYALPCINVAGGSASPPPATTIYDNSCNKPVAFTVNWSGSLPPKTSIYWMLPNETRRIVMQDLTGVMGSESDIIFTGGPAGDVEVQKRQIQGTPTTYDLIILNHHEVRTLVQVKLQLNYANGIHDGATGLPYAIKNSTLLARPFNMGDTSITGFPTDVFTSYQVLSLNSQDEPAP